MVFEYIDIDEVDDTYNPYDKYANNRIKKCKYGNFYDNSNYCCNKCFQENKYYKKLNKQNYINNLFNQNKNNKQSYFSRRYNIIEEETKEEIDDDWKTLKLQPPKTLSQIKKQYHKLSLKCHPDKGGTNEDFIKLNNSYNNLLILCN